MNPHLPLALICIWMTLSASFSAQAAIPAVPPLTAEAAATPTPPPPPPDKEWWYHPRKDHQPSGAPGDVKFHSYRVCYLGDTQGKTIYLTFDEGSETGCTPKILDVLKSNGVHATFFVTRYYMKESPALVKRMLAEGHVVGNHSATHPRLMQKSDDRIKREIEETANYYKNLTGKEMTRLFRPPYGECDERIMRIASGLGWRTVFWSMAYEDWLPTQKGVKYAEEFVMKYHHTGAIVLLHPYPSNAAALNAIVKKLKETGYTFGTLSESKEQEKG